MKAEFNAMGIFAGLSKPARKLLAEMSDGELVLSLDRMAKRANISIADSLAAMAEIKAHGLTVSGPLFDQDDGTLRGRGTWLNESGLAVQSHLERAEIV